MGGRPLWALLSMALPPGLVESSRLPQPMFTPSTKAEIGDHDENIPVRRMFEILDYKLYSWPGHGVSPEHPYQCNEAEYMKADEYDALIQDPTGYFLSTYLPRVFGALQPLQMLPFFPGILGS